MSKLTVFPDPSTGCTNYPAVDAASIHHIAIFPPLGISRVGDSDECFLAPEIPGYTTPPQALLQGTEYKFRDAHQKLRRQAVRFRVYAYDANNAVLGELNPKNGYTLTWKVDVANKKAAGYVFQDRFPPHKTELRNEKIHPGEIDPEKRFKLIAKAEGEISLTTKTGFVPLQGKFQGSKDTAADVNLAQLQLDEAGRLVFIPGKGGARSIADPNNPQPPVVKKFDNEDWIDEICDGTVTVKVENDGKAITNEVLGARVLSAPPKFAWGINMPTTLYDIMEDVYHQATNPHPLIEVDFWKHIWPVLESATLISWTNKKALEGHGESESGHFDIHEVFKLFKDPGKNLQQRKSFKSRIFARLRKRLENDDPDPKYAREKFMPSLSGDAGDMPKYEGTQNGFGRLQERLDNGDPGPEHPLTKAVPRLSGDVGDQLRNDIDPRRFAALTRLQYERFEKWKNDENFYLMGDGPPVPQAKLEDLPVAEQPEQLTRAILGSTIGDPLYPGIEMYWIAKLKEAYNLKETGINPPFRFNDTVLPGHLTQGLSLPWQSDFDMCRTHWWPATRPDDIVVKASVGTQDYARTDWKRGVPTQHPNEVNPYPGSDSMIKLWMQFGVVREVKSASNKESDFLEDEHVVHNKEVTVV